ncbi:MAG: response regulator [Betaproteobacteria bacterium]|nr:MAG: response regulator [Betaproteobacteria bacterium]
MRDFARSPKLLIADVEDYFCAELARAGNARGMEVTVASNVSEATQLIETISPDYVVVDQRLPPDGACRVMQSIASINRKVKCVVVTHYPSLACAVSAVKQGAWDYLAKPTSANIVLDSFANDFDDGAGMANAACKQPLSVDRLEWEHIHRVLALQNNNVSATARSLGMHRRTLQRKLAKYPPPR